MNRARWHAEGHPRRPPSRVGWLVIGVLVASGCAQRAESPFARARTDEPVRIEVDNANYLDVTIHFMSDGAWHRLGQITGASSGTLEIPVGLVPATGRFRLMVSPIGSREAYRSDDILINAGDVVQLRVASVLQMSSWSVLRG